MGQEEHALQAVQLHLILWGRSVGGAHVRMECVNVLRVRSVELMKLALAVSASAAQEKHARAMNSVVATIVCHV